MPYIPTDADVREAVERLRVFERQLGYPPNQQALLLTARAFTRIVHFKPPWEIIPNPPAELLGFKDDAEWLVAQVLEVYDRFPTMQKFREIYRMHLPPRYSREDIDL